MIRLDEHFKPVDLTEYIEKVAQIAEELVGSGKPTLADIDFDRPLRNDDMCPMSELRWQYCGLPCCNEVVVDYDIEAAREHDVFLGGSA